MTWSGNNNFVVRGMKVVASDEDRFVISLDAAAGNQERLVALSGQPSRRSLAMTLSAWRPLMRKSSSRLRGLPLAYFANVIEANPVLFG